MFINKSLERCFGWALMVMEKKKWHGELSTSIFIIRVSRSAQECLRLFTVTDRLAGYLIKPRESASMASYMTMLSAIGSSKLLIELNLTEL